MLGDEEGPVGAILSALFLCAEHYKEVSNERMGSTSLVCLR